MSHFNFENATWCRCSVYFGALFYFQVCFCFQDFRSCQELVRTWEVVVKFIQVKCDTWTGFLTCRLYSLASGLCICAWLKHVQSRQQKLSCCCVLLLAIMHDALLLLFLGIQPSFVPRARKPLRNLKYSSTPTGQYHLQEQMAKEIATAPQLKYRKDYAPAPYLIDTVDLDFILNEDYTLVVSKLELKPNYSGDVPAVLFLNGRCTYENPQGTSFT